MTDLLLRIGVSNLCISSALALIAWAVQSRGKRPMVAHLLWLLVLIKLVTLPLVTIPVVAVAESPASPVLVDDPVPETDVLAGAMTPDSSGATAIAVSTAPTLLEQTKHGLALLWLVGSACVLVWSLLRIYRFNRLLGSASGPASPELQSVAAELARRLGLSKVPGVHITSARLSPMVWWVGGRVRVFLPSSLLAGMDAGQVRWILAHELAHVRRRDHLTRWLEWLVCVGFWFNPVAWWARRNLRANEEICCDSLVLSTLHPTPQDYANSLLTVVEFLAAQALRPPAMASRINSGGVLERRFKMIVSKRPLSTTPRWLRVLMVLCVAALLPLGVAYAQSPDYDAVAARLVEAVQAGELTEEQAEAMMGELGRAAFAEHMKAAGRRRGGRDRDRDPGIEGHFKRLGVGEEAFDRIGAALKEGGIKGEHLEHVLGAILRVAHEMKSDGKRYEMDPGMRGFLMRRLRLTQKQVDLVEGIARRILHGAKKRGGDAGREERMAAYRAIEARINDAVKAGKLSKEDAKRTLEGARQRIFQGGSAKSKVAEFRRKLGAALEAGKITEEQAKAKWEAYMQRARQPGAKRGRATTPSREEMAKVKERIWAGVKEGKLTEEQARARWEGYLKHLRSADTRGKSKTPTRAEMGEVKKKIWAAVKAGEITEEQARQKWEAYLRSVKTRQEPERRGR